MYINRTRLGVILVAGVLMNLAGNALVFRTAVYLLCPEPAVSLECFDTLRHGMAEEDACAVIERPLTVLILSGCVLGVNPHREVQFRDNDLEIVLIIDNGVLTDGKALRHGQVLHHHLEPRDPIIDPMRLGLRQLETVFGQCHLLELLSYLVAAVAAIWLVGVLVAARQCTRGARPICDSLPPTTIAHPPT